MRNTFNDTSQTVICTVYENILLAKPQVELTWCVCETMWSDIDQQFVHQQYLIDYWINTRINVISQDFV